MSQDRVPGTPGKQAFEEERVVLQQPVKRTVLRPLGIGATKVGEETHVQLLLTPFEFVILELDEESKGVLLKELTGGLWTPP